VEELKRKEVSEVVIGYPKGISKDHGNKLTANFWNYGYTVKRFEEVGEEQGMKIVKVDEAYTSKACSLCGEVHESGRIKRGLFKCPHIGKVINADLSSCSSFIPCKWLGIPYCCDYDGIKNCFTRKIHT
jgi:putative transposase